MVEVIKTLMGPQDSWVVFENLTFVMLPEKAADSPETVAMDILREHGPVVNGTASGDFGILSLSQDVGWIVSSDHQRIRTFVPMHIFDKRPSDLQAGLYGREMRNKDIAEMKIVHIQMNQ